MKKLLFIVCAAVLSYAASGWLAGMVIKTESMMQDEPQAKRRGTSGSAFIPEPTRVPDADMVRIPASQEIVPAFDPDEFSVSPTGFPAAGGEISFSVPPSTLSPAPETPSATPDAELAPVDAPGISVESPLYALLLLLRAL
jgi:hypothetical protein